MVRCDSKYMVKKAMSAFLVFLSSCKSSSSTPPSRAVPFEILSTVSGRAQDVYGKVILESGVMSFQCWSGRCVVYLFGEKGIGFYV
ncbi:hypothetical protein CEXT_547621 [Caerostris extrusa]|uniref:Lipoprotein n=1 Tax=Caerostris extrusa TaxID=172846 RepID=A0AAV4N3V8_CAEEX|nr:hypothetical protein CEXT_547621 [Caerostris extrusa]